MKIKFSNDTKKKKDTYSYRGWLTSDSFHKRIFSIFSYVILAQLYIIFVIIILIYAISFIFEIIF